MQIFESAIAVSEFMIDFKTSFANKKKEFV